MDLLPSGIGKNQLEKSILRMLRASIISRPKLTWTSLSVEGDERYGSYALRHERASVIL